MRLFPAIDLKDGKCVRLKQGEFNNITVYCDEPYKVAEYFERCRADYIHLVDLDGALKGHSVNEEAIRKIVSSVSIPCELGGGIRTLDDIERVLSYGIERVIIGTKAVKEPEFIREAVKRYGRERIVIGVDAKNGKIATDGWEDISDVDAVSLCFTMKQLGIDTIIYTDISKDGMLSGPNIKATKELAEKTGMTVIASGGVSCMEDLDALENSGIEGVIIGKAIYEERINLLEAVHRYYIKTTDIPFSDFKLNSDGLIPVIVQEEKTGEVLMLAYMNEEAYAMTLESGRMTYYSRSRKEIWVKGLTSGHFQHLKSLAVDCDKDTLLAIVEQTGAACHTGSHSCFYQKIINNGK